MLVATNHSVLNGRNIPTIKVVEEIFFYNGVYVIIDSIEEDGVILRECSHPAELPQNWVIHHC